MLIVLQYHIAPLKRKKKCIWVKYSIYAAMSQFKFAVFYMFFFSPNLYPQSFRLQKKKNFFQFCYSLLPPIKNSKFSRHCVTTFSSRKGKTGNLDVHSSDCHPVSGWKSIIWGIYKPSFHCIVDHDWTNSSLGWSCLIWLSWAVSYLNMPQRTILCSLQIFCHGLHQEMSMGTKTTTKNIYKLTLQISETC